MKKKKIVKLIKDLIADLEAGKAKHWWDAGHIPRKAERDGRVLMLRALAKDVKRGDK